jgi:protein-S-isoprenylcysteine O-methyltransferase Ste14
MSLLQTLEKEGNWLFKRRGWLPALLFILAIPACYFGSRTSLTILEQQIINGSGIAIWILGLLLRAYTVGTTPRGTSGRNTKEQVAEVINTKGIYSIVRHPLYLANFLMWIGIVITTHSLGFTVAICLMYWLYYERIMIAEEQFLAGKFGSDFERWSGEVPAFLPSPGKFISGEMSFSWKAVLRREYSGILASVVAFAFVELLRNYFRNGEWSVSTGTLACLAIAILLTLILRTMKHSTAWLDESDRS